MASPSLLPWAALALLLFAAVNILLARMIFSWVERWLAQRRTREILGVLFLLFIISFQLIGPLMSRYGRSAHPGPPAIRGASFADSALVASGNGRFGHRERCPRTTMRSPPVLSAFLASMAPRFSGSCTSGCALNFAEKISAKHPRSRNRLASAELFAWAGSCRDFSGPVAAIFEKEIRYLSRSGPMLFTLIMPVFILFIFRLTPSTSHQRFGLFARQLV